MKITYKSNNGPQINITLTIPEGMRVINRDWFFAQLKAIDCSLEDITGFELTDGIELDEELDSILTASQRTSAGGGGGSKEEEETAGCSRIKECRLYNNLSVERQKHVTIIK